MAKTPTEAAMLLKASRDREWIPTDHAGVERARFRYNETG
jgi:hypothetical protein